VTLYQCAHVEEDTPTFTDLVGPDGRVFKADSCWKDLYYSLIEAEQLICITGWAVWDKLKLFRGKNRAIDDRTLGDILIEKANQGVQVYVMVWSEKTSGNIVGEKGFMGTHDMETYNRFKNTRVHCCLAPRELEINEFTDYLQNEFRSAND